MMKKAPVNVPEVALFMANTPPVNGWALHWLLSKSQIEFVLHDISALPPCSEFPGLQRAQHQDEVLPVLSLEQHYALETLPVTSGFKYIVTRVPTADGTLLKVILRICNPLRIRKLNFNAEKTLHTGLQKNSQDILGAFTLPDNQLIILPDIEKILVNIM